MLTYADVWLTYATGGSVAVVGDRDASVASVADNKAAYIDMSDAADKPQEGETAVLHRQVGGLCRLLLSSLTPRFQASCTSSRR
jgi:hypothetical protein